MNKLTLNDKIINLYQNTKLDNNTITKISEIYNDLKNQITKFCTRNKYQSPEILQHGSYALNTFLLMPNSEIDLDIGITFYCNNLNYNNVRIFKTKLFNFLKRKKHNVQKGKCAITLKFDNFHIDIVVYISVKDKQYILWNNYEFILDNKHAQYKYIKQFTENNDTLKQIICFVKYIYKNIDKNKYINCILPSIAITELIISVYIKKISEKFKYFNSITYTNTFNNTINKFNNYNNNVSFLLIKILYISIHELEINFTIRNSGSNDENYLYNSKRQLHREDTINLLCDIYDSLYESYNGNKLSKNNLLYDILQKKNNLMLDKVQYDKICNKSKIFTNT